MIPEERHAGDTLLRETLIGDYNDFCPRVVARALQDFAVDAVVAREGSVCLYLFPDPDEDRAFLKTALRFAAADEIHDQGQTGQSGLGGIDAFSFVLPVDTTQGGDADTTIVRLRPRGGEGP